MKKPNIYRENGQLKVNITINKDGYMLEMEDQIAGILDSKKEELSELEKLQVTQQIIEAFNSEKQQKV
jgi:hypothetical protein